MSKVKIPFGTVCVDTAEYIDLKIEASYLAKENAGLENMVRKVEKILLDQLKKDSSPSKYALGWVNVSDISDAIGFTDVLKTEVDRLKEERNSAYEAKETDK